MTREEIEKEFGKENVWDTNELQETFIVNSFLAPFTFVQRKKDGVKGTVMFQHSPRFYFQFVEIK